MAQQGTKDVSQAQIRTDLSPLDEILLVNHLTREVQRVAVGDVIDGGADGEANAAPAFYDEFFGI